MTLPKIMISCLFIVSYSCSFYLPSEDIETVKNLTLPFFEENGYLIRDFTSDIAGKNGFERWSVFLPEGYKNNHKIGGVQVDIIRNSMDYNLIQLQFEYLRSTESARLSKITVDGMRKSKLEFYIILIEIGINSVMSDLGIHLVVSG